MNKQLLVDTENMTVYVGNLELIWLDPTLYMEYKGQDIAITRCSGEYENEIGTFFLNIYNLSNDESDYAVKIMKEIANSESIEEIESLGVIKFTLKESYLSKIDNLYENASRKDY